MQWTRRLVLIVSLTLLAVPAATVHAAPRMLIGFFDDPSFRWSGQTQANLAAAHEAGATIIHVTADWSQIAPTRPASPLEGDDPAYRLSDLDAVVRDASKYDLQVMIDISQTPKWANGGTRPNHAPLNMGDLTNFAHMLAARYNGKNPGYGSVARWAIWNEPNLELFLTPQFKGKQIVSPQIYAKIFAAGYRGIKAGNPLAQVAAGETSNRGRDTPVQGVSGSVAPATFARLFARYNRIRFDAWATHPYPTSPGLGPTQTVKWPNVTMTQIDHLGQSLRSWYHRRVPVWITEYGQQTKPEYSLGVTKAQQAIFAKQALQLAAKSTYVEMFCWFILRDSANTWKSGLLTASGARKPAYAAFSSLARLMDGQTYYVRAGSPVSIRLFVPYLGYQNQTGQLVGVTYRIYDSTNKLIAIGQPQSPLAADQSISFVAEFAPARRKTYSLVADVNDRNGAHVTRNVTIVAS